MAQDTEGTGASLDTLSDHRAGRATALTTLTPLPRFWSPLLQAVLWIKARRGPDETLRRLSFIHAAYWVVIDRFPGERRRASHSRLLFASNFNGSWFDYIDVFTRAVPHKMVLIWGSSFGFPGPRPPRAFTRYIRLNDRPLDHYYAAYPEATTTEIASAVRVGDMFEDAVRPALADPEQLPRAWRDFLVKAQRDL